MTEHEHEFDDGSPGTIALCVDRKCTEMRVRTTQGWRDLTTTERTEVTLLMAFQIIHGKEAGLARYWYLSGRGPAA